MHQHLEITLLQFLHAAAEHDAAAIDEHKIGEHMLDLFHFVRRHYDGAAAVEVIIQQRIVKLLAVQDVQTQRRLIQYQQLRIHRHHEGEVQLGHHALREFPDLTAALDGGLGQKFFRLRAVKSRMHVGYVLDHLRNAYPAWQHGDVSDKADVSHELVTLSPRIASENFQLSLIGC